MKDPLQSEATPYEVLGIEHKAGDRAIQSALRLKTSKTTNIDKLMTARKLLMDPIERARVDLYLYNDEFLKLLKPSPLYNINLLAPKQRWTTALAWEAILRKEMTNLALIHSLALVWYWWGRHEERRMAELARDATRRGIALEAITNKKPLLLALCKSMDIACKLVESDKCTRYSCPWRDHCSYQAPSLEDTWRRVIAYWATLAHSPAFWANYTDLEVDSIIKVWKSAVENHLFGLFTNYERSYAEAGAVNLAAPYKSLDVVFRKELRTAPAIARAGFKIGLPDKALSGGVLMWDRLGLLEDLRKQIDQKAEENPNDLNIMELKTMLSPFSEIAELVEEKDWERALAAIRALSDEQKGKPEVRRLAAQALFIKGKDLMELGHWEQARIAWESALGSTADRNSLETMKEDIADACEKQSPSLSSKDLDGAVRLMEFCLKLLPDQGKRALYAHLLSLRGTRKIDAARKKADEAKRSELPLPREVITAVEEGIEDLMLAIQNGSVEAEIHLRTAKDIYKVYVLNWYRRSLDVAAKSQSWDDVILFLRHVLQRIEGEEAEVLRTDLALHLICRAEKFIERAREELDKSEPSPDALKETSRQIEGDLVEAYEIDRDNEGIEKARIGYELIFEIPLILDGRSESALHGRFSDTMKRRRGQEADTQKGEKSKGSWKKTTFMLVVFGPVVAPLLLLAMMPALWVPILLATAAFAVIIWKPLYDWISKALDEEYKAGPPSP